MWCMLHMLCFFTRTSSGFIHVLWGLTATSWTSGLHNTPLKSHRWFMIKTFGVMEIFGFAWFHTSRPNKWPRPFIWIMLSLDTHNRIEYQTHVSLQSFVLLDCVFSLYLLVKKTVLILNVKFGNMSIFWLRFWDFPHHQCAVCMRPFWNVHLLFYHICIHVPVIYLELFTETLVLHVGHPKNATINLMEHFNPVNF